MHRWALDIVYLYAFSGSLSCGTRGEISHAPLAEANFCLGLRLQEMVCDVRDVGQSGVRFDGALGSSGTNTSQA